MQCCNFAASMLTGPTSKAKVRGRNWMYSFKLRKVVRLSDPCHFDHILPFLCPEDDIPHRIELSVDDICKIHGWIIALQKPKHLLEVMRNLVLKKRGNTSRTVNDDQTTQEAVDIVLAGQDESRQKMTIGNAGIQHRNERSWWMTGSNSLKQTRTWQQYVHNCSMADNLRSPVMIEFAGNEISMGFEDKTKSVQDLADPGSLFRDRSG
jgi:hypothetical protein